MKNLSLFAKGIYPNNEMYPMLKNCLIDDSYIICSNDFITLCYNTQLKIKGCYDTLLLLKLLNTFDFTAQMSIIESENITCISQGNFKVNVNKIPPENYPLKKPADFTKEVFNPLLIRIFKDLQQYIGVDASRSWCLGIHIFDNTVYATNNVVCCGVKTTLNMQNRFIPVSLIEKIITLSDKGFIPKYYIDNDLFTGFEYEEGHQFFSRRTAEPMDLSKPLIMEEPSWIIIDDTLIDSVIKVCSFTDELYVDFDNDIIQTHKDKDFGAKITYKNKFGIGGAFIHKYFIPLLQYSSHLCFYKDRALFYKNKKDYEFYAVEVRYVI